MCLTVDQGKCIYKKVEQESIVNVETIKQEIEEYRLDKTILKMKRRETYAKV